MARSWKSTHRTSPSRFVSPAITASRWTLVAIRQRYPSAKAPAKFSAMARHSRCEPTMRCASSGAICACANFIRWHRSTLSTAGRRSATAVASDHRPRVMYRRTWWALPTWTSTAPGAMRKPTATSGSRGKCRANGRRIDMAIGHGSIRGAGLGSMTHRGALHPFTMAGGRNSTIVGVGCLARSTCARSTRPRLSYSWVGPISASP